MSSELSRRKGWLLALDQGGHASRALIFDKAGHVISQAQVPVATRLEGGDRVEHDADELAASLQQAADDACDGAHAVDGDLVAAGLATQRSTIVCWDRVTGQALSPAISWQDRRGRAQVDALRADEARIRAISGLVLSPHYGASKLRWCLDHIAEVRASWERASLCAGPLSAFLLYRLLQERPTVVDPANAARTQLFDPALNDWSAALLDIFAVPASILPRCVPTSSEFGTLRVGRVTVPLSACTGDQAAAPFAFGSPDEDTAYINAGTGAFVQRLTRADSPVPPGLLRSVLFSTGSEVQYSLEGTVNGAGSAVDWLRNQVAIDVTRAVRSLPETMAEEPPLFINGVGGLGAPYWQAGFAIEFIGSGDEPSRLRAVIESIVFLLSTNLDAMQAAGPLRRIVLTGGFADCDYFCRALANLNRMDVERFEMSEATARGTAFLAADRPASWSPVALRRRFAPSSDARLSGRFDRWRTAMRERGARIRDGSI